MALRGLLRRAWIPVLVITVVVGAAFAVSRVRAVSGRESQAAYGKSEVADIGRPARKSVEYQVFGPVVAEADISYLDVNADPRRVAGASLPWSVTFTTESAAVVGSVVAQGDGDSIGCRILIDGQVKAERISHNVSAFTYCRLKA